MTLPRFTWSNVRRRRYVVMARRKGFNADPVSHHRSLNAACKVLARVNKGKPVDRLHPAIQKDLAGAWIYDRAHVHGEMSPETARHIVKIRTRGDL